MRVTVTDDSPARDGKFLCDSVAQCVPSAEMLTIGGVMGETTDLGTVTTLQTHAGLGLAPGEVGRQPCAPRLDTLHLNCVML